MRKSIYYITRYKFVFLAVVLETVLISCSQNDTHIQNEIEFISKEKIDDAIKKGYRYNSHIHGYMICEKDLSQII